MYHKLIVRQKEEMLLSIKEREAWRGREKLERCYREIKNEYGCQNLCLKDGD